jgi:tRNA 5-methylaminomethyl-2-thiouridine biosynthesis bifunctional protein
MPTMPIQPALLQFAAGGTPRSEIYDDVYYSADGGLGQARHVFLAGNGLPERWRGRERFVVLETGFGLGLNFLATWAAWRDDPARPRVLHFVSCDLHPFRGEDLARLHARWPELAVLAHALRAGWPPLAGGMHRLHFDEGRVCLTLYFGDVREGLAQIEARADALFLDGFSPAKNPAMWSAKVFYLLARLSAPDATLATWSVAGEVREGLRRACFVTEKVPGFGGKREMLRGVLYPHPRRVAAAPPAPAMRHAVVVGAGAAGTAVAERLAARAWAVDVVDACDGPGQGASGNHAGVLRPQPSLDDNRLSRLSRAGALYGWRHIERARAAGGTRWAAACGVLHLGRDAAQEEKMRAVVARLALPEEVLRHVEAAEASALAGWAVPLGGWWFPGCGWVRPPSLCAANLAMHPHFIRTHWRRAVAAVVHRGGRWQALAADGGVIAAAPVMILAAGVGVAAFAQAAPLPVRGARGQVSVLSAAAGSAPHAVVCGGGYVTPAVDGRRCAGASFTVDDGEAAPRLCDQQANLAKLEALLPGYTAGLDAAALGARVGFRPLSPDRLPLAGAMPATIAAAPEASLAALPRHDGLYVLSGFGARGLAWAALVGEMLAARIDGDPLPLERELVEAMDPGRFLLRHKRSHVTEGDGD